MFISITNKSDSFKSDPQNKHVMCGCCFWRGAVRESLVGRNKSRRGQTRGRTWRTVLGDSNWVTSQPSSCERTRWESFHSLQTDPSMQTDPPSVCMLVSAADGEDSYGLEERREGDRECDYQFSCCLRRFSQR